MRVLRVQKTETVRVNVVRPDGVPAPRALVWIDDVGREPCATDDAGTVVLRDLPCGPLRMRAEPRVEGNELFGSVETDVDGERMVTLTLRASATIDGTVVDKDNKIVERAVVAVHNDSEVYLTDVVGQTFSVRVPAGGVWSVSARGVRDVWCFGRGVVAGVTSGSAGVVVRLE
jgi:hypothetical protein